MLLYKKLLLMAFGTTLVVLSTQQLIRTYFNGKWLVRRECKNFTAGTAKSMTPLQYGRDLPNLRKNVVTFKAKKKNLLF